MPIEPTNVVMVSARRSDGSYMSGSGYLGNRWPLLADHLQEHPEAVKLFQERPEQFDASMPEEIISLFTDPPDSLRAVMNHPDGPLTTQAIRECSGQTIPAPTSAAPES